jgi:hypothetical protein
MRIHRFSRLAPCLFLTIAACNGDRIVGGAAGPSMENGSDITLSAVVERPWRGDCDVDAVFTGATTLLITGTCQLAHLGRVTLVATQTITPGASGIAFTNTSVYTAPDGDELRTSNVGIASPTAGGLTLAGIETATGGTGRFSDAEGSATLSGAVSFTSATTTTGSYTIDGRLSY